MKFYGIHWFHEVDLQMINNWCTCGLLVAQDINIP